MGDQDWDTVVLRKKQPKSGKLKSQQALSAAQRAGLEIDTQKKFGAATNKHTGTSMNTAKLDRETEELKHSTVGLDVGKLIQQGRQAKNMTQKDLATKINEKPQVVNDYEAGRAIPNQTIIGKLERVLEMKLRGAHKGEVLVPKTKK